MFGLLHVFAVVDNAAVGMGCMYLFELALSFSSDICPGLGLLVVRLPIFNFLRSLHALFHGAVPICLLTNSIQGFPFSTSLRALVVCGHFMVSILTSMG